MQIIETTISKSTVVLRLTEDKGNGWIAIQLELGSLEQAGLVGDPKRASSSPSQSARRNRR